MSRIFRLLLIPVLISLLASCAPGPAGSGSQQSVSSKKPRAAAQVSDQDRSALAAGNTAFALDLYHRLASADQNMFYSPYSISLALAMAYAGARGNTAKQMAGALHFTLPADQLHPAFNSLDQELATRKELPGQGTGGKGADSKGFRLNIVNDIWGQQGHTFQPAFLDLLAMDYGSGLREIDFQHDAEGARKTINDYIAQKTEQRIKDLIPQGAIDPLTRMVLTNAIYFNAAWMYPFDKDLTKTAPFTRLDGSKVDVSMMRLPATEQLMYAAGDGYQAIALPYENQNLSMLLLVPDQGRFADFESRMDAAALANILGQMKVTPAKVLMPGFKTESSFSLAKELSGMGMADAFSPGQADFSGMDGTRDLAISDVVHKAFVKVDESGTEAAAATAVMMPAAAMNPENPVTLTIDRPFIFMIRDEPTNTILFIGKLLDPTK